MSYLKKKLKEFKQDRKWKKAAEKQIKTKAKAEYYKAQEKEAKKDAQRRAKEKYAPKKPSQGLRQLRKPSYIGKTIQGRTTRRKATTHPDDMPNPFFDNYNKSGNGHKTKKKQRKNFVDPGDMPNPFWD